MSSDDASERSAAEAEAEPAKGVRWPLQLLAFAPTLALAVCVAGAQLPYIYLAYESPSAAEAITTMLLRVAGCLPFAMPVYLYFLGRRYVRVVHGGLKNPGPFALMYSAANLGVWLLGSCLVALSYGGR